MDTKTGIDINDWTHRDLQIEDIRKFFNYYTLKIKNVPEKIQVDPINVNSNIFEDRIRSYFLVKDTDNVPRKDILDLKWNMHISKGCFYKYVPAIGKFNRVNREAEKHYISFLEIAGPLVSLKDIFSK